MTSVLGAAHSLAAQTARTHFIYQVYADPHYGDDALASALNPAPPGLGGPIPPLGVHLDPGVGLKPINGPIVQAPYSFRTVSAALAYITVAFPGGLPWTDGSGQRVEKVVIHCLPGLYGPRLTGTPLVDPNSGQVWNGDAFPLVIPHGVSIRGTSALASVFDARGTAVSIFDVVADGTQLHEFDFINGVTIRNARSVEESPPGTGAGVYIHGTGTSLMTVSNCFIVGNTVGVAVASDSTKAANAHQPRVVNNTIAWNGVGIWNGDLNASGIPSLGYHLMQILNNVIDASPPDVVRYPAPVSAFEGVSQSQTMVTALQTSGGSVAVNQNMNAWPVGYHNRGLAIANWPVTLQTGANQAFARFDLTPVIGHGIIGRTGNVRAILYVNDALVVRLGTDHSPHDFRLAPVVRAMNNATMNNPLVNLGVALTGPYIQINMVPVAITVPPGPSSAGDLIDPPATIHCWDWDAEGFGNPRITGRAGFASGQYADIDLGADEMDALIQAGYIDSTRIYSHNVPSAQGIVDHTRVFFLDLPSGPYPRPVFNSLVGGFQAPSIYYQWWTHVQTPVNALAGTNYTRGNASPVSSRFVLTDPFGLPGRVRPPFMRNLMCDVSPHLVQDSHPLWAWRWDTWFDPYPPPSPRYNDVYASHPWYDAVLDPVTGSWGVIDNPYLFHNPSWYPLPSANDWAVGYHRVTLGITSPPGSYFVSTSPSYLMGGLPTTTFGPFGACTPATPGTYAVDALGVGDTGTACPDALPWFPGLIGLGIRMNCQRSDASGVFSGNLQSFLIVTTNTQNPIDEGLWAGRSRQVGDSERARDGLRSLPQAAEWLRRRGG